MVFIDTNKASSSGRSPCDRDHTLHETPPNVHHEKQRLNLLIRVVERREISNKFTTTDLYTIFPLGKSTFSI